MDMHAVTCRLTAKYGISSVNQLGLFLYLTSYNTLIVWYFVLFDISDPCQFFDAVSCVMEKGSLNLLDVCLVIPSEVQSTGHLSPSSSVLCCHLHLPPAVPQTSWPHFFYSSFSLIILLLSGL